MISRTLSTIVHTLFPDHELVAEAQRARLAAATAQDELRQATRAHRAEVAAAVEKFRSVLYATLPAEICEHRALHRAVREALRVLGLGPGPDPAQPIAGHDHAVVVATAAKLLRAVSDWSSDRLTSESFTPMHLDRIAEIMDAYAKARVR